MALQTTQPKTRWPLLIGLIVAGIVVAGLAYWFFLRQPSLPQEADASTGPSINTTFKTKVLDDVRLKSLKQYGQPEVQVQERGNRPNPFQPF